jgi:hypothetical protein
MFGYILGDSGYPCTNILLTPYPNPQLPHEKRFNKALTSTRVRVEMVFGRFRSRYLKIILQIYAITSELFLATK